ncbi:MAG: hypothetical protein IJ586_00585, partial [Alloprevotella sp.]|nr:hypothetical protein [Alloprevotella sp.]
MHLKALCCALVLIVSSSNTSAQNIVKFAFDTAADFDLFSVIDENRDEQTWQYDDYDYAAFCSRDNNADDWLISPSVSLEAGKLYKVSVRAKGYSADRGETFQVTLGGGTTPITHTHVLIDATVESDEFTEFFAMFSVETA